MSTALPEEAARDTREDVELEMVKGTEERMEVDEADESMEVDVEDNTEDMDVDEKDSTEDMDVDEKDEEEPMILG
ncbi:PREDICTED: histone deacetylase HDT2-like isoform X3 [Ficedula albicollis]|uniref:histone deacetylase HDT2-like isoform X3 n=1 Tax=Ficedula albicollis TaxID=59894 RepID=UPI0007AD88B5|nr:PREDICTED: histone deacetylase HDT2-like isoform X3 [Ficedula albicollis]